MRARLRNDDASARAAGPTEGRAKFRAAGQRSGRLIEAWIPASKIGARQARSASQSGETTSLPALCLQASPLALRARIVASALASLLLRDRSMDQQKIIAVRHLRAGGRLIPVQ